MRLILLAAVALVTAGCANPEAPPPRMTAGATGSAAGSCASGVCALPQEAIAKEESLDDVEKQFQARGMAGRSMQGGGPMKGGMNMAAMMANCPCMKMMAMQSQPGGAAMDHSQMQMGPDQAN